LIKAQPYPPRLFIHNPDFATDVLFIRSKIGIGARSAQRSNAEIGERWRKLKAAAVALARTAARPRGLSIAHG